MYSVERVLLLTMYTQKSCASLLMPPWFRCHLPLQATKACHLERSRKIWFVSDADARRHSRNVSGPSTSLRMTGNHAFLAMTVRRHSTQFTMRMWPTLPCAPAPPRRADEGERLVNGKGT